MIDRSAKRVSARAAPPTRSSVRPRTLVADAQSFESAARPGHQGGAPLDVHAISRAVGARLRELRLDAELSQQQLSNLTGIHRPIVCRLERGIHLQQLEEIRRYARALDLDVCTVLEPLRIETLVALPNAQEASCVTG
jgi:ribosome-binding protein aMBF1 (putative translation factor)